MRWSTVAVAAIVLVSLALRARHLDGPPLGPHSFRQTQTAFTVQTWLEHGFTILQYETPVFGPPWKVPFELPTYQASAYVLARAGVPVDLACRIAALAWFYASAALLVAIARRYLGEVAAVVALAAYVLTPFSILWSRSILIDYASVALALGYLLATAEWAERRTAGAWLSAVALGALATTTKITTIPIVALGLAFVALAALRRAWQGGAVALARTSAALAGIAGVPLVAVLLWTRWADAVKGASPATRWLTSEALHVWNFGTLPQRLDPQAWDSIGSRLKFIVPGLLFVAIALAAVSLWRRPGPARAAVLAALGGAMLPVLIFFNLHLVHDYYQVAVTPGLALLAGAGAAELVAIRLPWRAAVLGLLPVAAVATSVKSFRYAKPAWEDARRDPYVALARLVEEVTPRDRWVVVEGDGWNPRIPYLAHRRAFMIVPPPVPVALVPDRPEVSTLVCKSCPKDLLDRWPEHVLLGREGGFDVYATRGRSGAGAAPNAWRTGAAP
jgi:4-amino-4-deoxy-L-arabinose transferase-like glycosyltransferase